MRWSGMGLRIAGISGDCQHIVGLRRAKSGDRLVPSRVRWRNPRRASGISGTAAEQCGGVRRFADGSCRGYPAPELAENSVHAIHRPNHHLHPFLYFSFLFKRWPWREQRSPCCGHLAGEPVWPPPIWLMRQAGRYLPEYRAVRAKAADFIALCTTPDLAAEVTLQPIRRYRFDAAILFSDILMLPWALGQGLEYREGEGPVLPPLRDAAGVQALAVRSGCRPRSRRSWRRCGGFARGWQTKAFADCALIGFAGAPFTVACYMVEGGGSRDFAATRTMAYAEPALFERLIDAADRGDGDLSVGADRGRRRSGDAVRQLGRHPVAGAVSRACDRADAGDRARAAGAVIPTCRSSAFRASRACWSVTMPTATGVEGRRAGHVDGPGLGVAQLVPPACRPARQSRSAGAGRRRRRHCGGDPRPSWTRCRAARSSSTSATASCRRRRPSMSQRWWSRCVRPRVAVVLFNLGGPGSAGGDQAVPAQSVQRPGDSARAVLRPAVPGTSHRRARGWSRRGRATPRSAADRRCSS